VASDGLGLVQTQRAVLFDEDSPLVMHSGATLAPVTVAYETYGELDADGSNAVFVCHALSGDAHAAGHHGDPARRGWWDNIIGPGRPLDTDRFFVISPNILGGCGGTSGPASIDPRSGLPYGLRFPLITVRDLVAVHRALLAQLPEARASDMLSSKAHVRSKQAETLNHTLRAIARNPFRVPCRLRAARCIRAPALDLRKLLCTRRVELMRGCA